MMKLYRRKPQTGDRRIYVDYTGQMLVPSQDFNPVEIVAFVEEVSMEDDFDYFVESPFKETLYFKFVSQWAKENYGKKYIHKTNVLDAVTCPHCLKELNLQENLVQLEYAQTQGT